MNRPFKTYNGGKNGSGVYQAIINQIPPHDVFISAFAGNCGVLANKRRASMANIAIDVDASVIKGWKTIPGITAINADAISILKLLPKFYNATETLNIIFNTKFTFKEKLFVFIDSPYLMSERSSKKNYYKHEMSDRATHLNMLAAAKNLKCDCLIIHYPCDLYDNALKGWRTLDIKGRTRKGIRIERIYMNYPEPTALHDYSYIGKDFRERELFKKSKANAIAKFERMSPLERNFIIDSLAEKNLL